MASSISYWQFSTDLETHLLPAALFVYVLILLVETRKTAVRRILSAGIIHALCIFLSGVYLFFIPAALTAVMTAKGILRGRLKNLAAYLATLTACWTLPFFALGVLFYRMDCGLKYADNLSGHLFLWFRSFEKLIPLRAVSLQNIIPCYVRTLQYITLNNRLTISLGLFSTLFYAAFPRYSLLTLSRLKKDSPG